MEDYKQPYMIFIAGEYSNAWMNDVNNNRNLFTKEMISYYNIASDLKLLTLNIYSITLMNNDAILFKSPHSKIGRNSH